MDEINKSNHYYKVNFGTADLVKLMSVNKHNSLSLKFKNAIFEQKKVLNKRDKLNEIQEKYIQDFFNDGNDRTILELQYFVDNAFIGMTYNKTNVKNLLDERNRIWGLIGQAYDKGNVSQKTVE